MQYADYDASADKIELHLSSDAVCSGQRGCSSSGGSSSGGSSSDSYDSAKCADDGDGCVLRCSRVWLATGSVVDVQQARRGLFFIFLRLWRINSR